MLDSPDVLLVLVRDAPGRSIDAIPKSEALKLPCLQCKVRVKVVKPQDDQGNPIIALFLALAFIGALGSTVFEYMVRLGYDQAKQKLRSSIAFGLDFRMLRLAWGIR